MTQELQREGQIIREVKTIRRVWRTITITDGFTKENLKYLNASKFGDSTWEKRFDDDDDGGEEERRRRKRMMMMSVMMLTIMMTSKLFDDDDGNDDDDDDDKKDDNYDVETENKEKMAKHQER